MHQWSYLAIIATILNTPGYYFQVKLIIKTKSGEAVSLAWFASSLTVEIVNALYGGAFHDSWFTYNALVCAVGQLAVILALGAYKPPKTSDKMFVALLSFILGTAVITPFKAITQAAAMLANIYGGVHQPLTLKNAIGGTGALSLVSLLFSLASTLLWIGYCYRAQYWGPMFGYMTFGWWAGGMVALWCRKSLSTRISQ